MIYYSVIDRNTNEYVFLLNNYATYLTLCYNTTICIYFKQGCMRMKMNLINIPYALYIIDIGSKIKKGYIRSFNQ